MDLRFTVSLKVDKAVLARLVLFLLLALPFPSMRLDYLVLNVELRFA